MARSVTIYREDHGEVIRIPIVRKPVGESYDAKIDVPFERRVLDTYRALESDGKLTGHFKNSQQATFVRDAWRRELGE